MQAINTRLFAKIFNLHGVLLGHEQWSDAMRTVIKPIIQYALIIAVTRQLAVRTRDGGESSAVAARRATQRKVSLSVLLVAFFGAKEC